LLNITFKSGIFSFSFKTGNPLIAGEKSSSFYGIFKVCFEGFQKDVCNKRGEKK